MTVEAKRIAPIHQRREGMGREWAEADGSVGGMKYQVVESAARVAGVSRLAESLSR